MPVLLLLSFTSMRWDAPPQCLLSVYTDNALPWDYHSDCHSRSSTYTATHESEIKHLLSSMKDCVFLGRGARSHILENLAVLD